MNGMDDTGWLVLAGVAGGLAAFLWIVRERSVRRRRRKS